MLTQEDRKTVELIKKIVIENKTTLLSFRNQDCKKVKLKTEKVSKLLQNTLTYNITEQNELIYAEAKLVSHKIGTSQRNLKGNTKAG